MILCDFSWDIIISFMTVILCVEILFHSPVTNVMAFLCVKQKEQQKRITPDTYSPGWSFCDIAEKINSKYSLQKTLQ